MNNTRIDKMIHKIIVLKMIHRGLDN